MDDLLVVMAPEVDVGVMAHGGVHALLERRSRGGSPTGAVLAVDGVALAADQNPREGLPASPPGGVPVSLGVRGQEDVHLLGHGDAGFRLRPPPVIGVVGDEELAFLDEREPEVACRPVLVRGGHVGIPHHRVVDLVPRDGVFDVVPEVERVGIGGPEDVIPVVHGLQPIVAFVSDVETAHGEDRHVLALGGRFETKGKTPHGRPFFLAALMAASRSVRITLSLPDSMSWWIVLAGTDR